MHNYKYKGSALRAREQTCVFFYFRKNIPLALDTFEIFTHGICERRKSKSALRRRSLLETTFAASTLTGVKKSHIICLLTYELGVEPFLPIPFLIFFLSSYAQVSQSLTFRHARLRMCHVYARVLFVALQFHRYVVLAVVYSPIKMAINETSCRFVRTSRLKVPL